jgi:YfiH family protein
MTKFITECTGSKLDFSKPNRQTSISELAEELDINPEQIKTVTQTHGDNICIVREASQETANFCADCLITNLPNICIGIKTADCIPLALFDPVEKVIAMIHLGRKSLLLGLLEKTLDILIKDFGVNPANLQAVLFASLQQKNHFIFAKDALQFPSKYIQHLPTGTHISNNSALFWEHLEKNQIKLEDMSQHSSAMVNPEAFVIDKLLESGVLETHISGQGVDSFADRQFASYRRDYPNHILMLSYCFMKI